MSTFIVWATILRRVIFTNFHQNNAFHVFKKATPKKLVLENAAKRCLALHFVRRGKICENVLKLKPKNGLDDTIFEINGSQHFCSSATEETPKQKSEEISAVPKKTEISYDELLTFIGSEMKYIFDVRDESDVNETGMIPCAINIPLKNLKSSMLLSDEEFQKAYNVKKPTLNESNHIIFYGHSSVKSSAALEIFQKMGYKKARQYSGGFEEWKQKESTK